MNFIYHFPSVKVYTAICSMAGYQEQRWDGAAISAKVSCNYFNRRHRGKCGSYFILSFTSNCELNVVTQVMRSSGQIKLFLSQTHDGPLILPIGGVSSEFLKKTFRYSLGTTNAYNLEKKEVI